MASNGSFRSHFRRIIRQAAHPAMAMATPEGYYVLAPLHLFCTFAPLHHLCTSAPGYLGTKESKESVAATRGAAAGDLLGACSRLSQNRSLNCN